MIGVSRILAVAIGGTLVLASWSCSDGQAVPARSAPSPPSPAQLPPVAVSVAPVLQKPMPLTLDVIGTAEAYSTVAVHSQITGELTSVNFTDGADVKEGQELFTLDRRPLEAVVQQMEANLDRDVAQLANAKAQFQRYQDLANRGIATREQLDQSRTNTAALDATTVADRAALESARVQLAYATIRSPVAGRVGKLLVSVGNLVRAGDTSPLVVINQVSPIYVVFGIPEAQLPELKRYMARGALRVDARAPTESGEPSIGRVAFIDNAVDQATGTIAVRAVFPNADRRLWPGQFVNVTVTLDTDPKALVIPTSALQESQQGRLVFVVKGDQTVESRVVHVVRAAGSETVIADGVQPGDRLVTDGQIRLVSGSRVNVRAPQ